MIYTFIYRTEIGKKEFRQTVYSKDIESSIQKWINQLRELNLNSFDSIFVDEIKSEFENNKIELKKDGESPYLIYQLNNKIQITYIDKLDKGQPDFIAKLQFLDIKEGGRKRFAASGYRPHFQILDRMEMTSAEQIFVDKDKVLPGDKVISEIRILWVDGFAGLLENGMNFQLKEGPRVIANGEVIEVINEKLKKSDG